MLKGYTHVSIYQNVMIQVLVPINCVVESTLLDNNWVRVHFMSVEMFAHE